MLLADERAVTLLVGPDVPDAIVGFLLAEFDRAMHGACRDITGELRQLVGRVDVVVVLSEDAGL